jgi:hypothetical protein
VSVLQQRGALAKVRRRLQVRLRGDEVALLGQRLGEPDVEVAGRREGPARRLFQGPRPSAMSASTTVMPRLSATLPAARMCRTAWVKVASASGRSPAAHAASPRKPEAAPRTKWSSSRARSRARLAWATVPATSPPAWATVAR